MEDKLKEFLLSLSYDDFGKEAKIKKGVAYDDIEFFKMDKSKITLDTVICYGDMFLVDALGNDLSIIKLTKKRYKLPNGRVIRGKYIRTVINDCNKIYGSPLNGYWVIPDKHKNKG